MKDLAEQSQWQLRAASLADQMAHSTVMDEPFRGDVYSCGRSCSTKLRHTGLDNGPEVDSKREIPVTYLYNWVTFRVRFVIICAHPRGLDAQKGGSP